MPRVASTKTIVRLLRILWMLPRAPQKLTTRAIFARLRARGHAVTVRTVERDLQRLRLVVPIVLDDKHKPYGWSWDRHARSAMLE